MGMRKRPLIDMIVNQGLDPKKANKSLDDKGKLRSHIPHSEPELIQATVENVEENLLTNEKKGVLIEVDEQKPLVTEVVKSVPKTVTPAVKPESTKTDKAPKPA